MVYTCAALEAPFPQGIQAGVPVVSAVMDKLAITEGATQLEDALKPRSVVAGIELIDPLIFARRDRVTACAIARIYTVGVEPEPAQLVGDAVAIAQLSDATKD